MYFAVLVAPLVTDFFKKSPPFYSKNSMGTSPEAFGEIPLEMLFNLIVCDICF